MKSVIIVGAGVIGLMCAVRLAKGGARVTLLEAEGDDVSVFSPTVSASAAGMLAPFDLANIAHERAALASLDLWRAWAKDSAWADGVRFEGGVVLCADAGKADALQAAVAAQGRRAEPQSAAQIKRRTGLDARTEHGVFIADEGVADPLRVLSGLALDAHTHGVILRRNADVMAATATTATTYDDEIFEADCVILAPGVWANDALMKAAPALKLVTPAKGHLVSVALARTLHPNVHAPGFYLAERREEVVLGASQQPGVFQRQVEPAEVEKLMAAAEAMLPGQVRQRGRAWAGVRPMSPDGWPMIGASGKGLLVAAGHSRNGWLLAPITAEIISAHVFGAPIAPEWAALSPQRFETP